MSPKSGQKVAQKSGCFVAPRAGVDSCSGKLGWHAVSGKLGWLQCRIPRWTQEVLRRGSPDC